MTGLPIQIVAPYAEHGQEGLRSGETAFAYERSVQPLPKLGPWTADLDRLLETNDRKARRERLTMIRMFEELQGLGYKPISLRVGAVPSTVRETLKRAAAARLSWTLDEALGDAALEASLYRDAGKKTGHRRCLEPIWARLHRELKRKHVTLQVLWDEYIAQHPGRYRYSRFCDLYRGWAMKLPVSMFMLVACPRKARARDGLE